MPHRRVSGPVYGYRAWRPRGSGLYSFWGGGVWPDDRPKVGLCWRNFLPVRVHVAPGAGHNCGLYAWSEPPEERYSPRGVNPVWGVVELAGKLAIHEHGYRAQYARPVAVEYVAGIEAIAERYGLVVLEDLSDWSR